MITIPIAKLINTNNTAPIDPAVAKYAKIGEGVAHGMLITNLPTKPIEVYK